MFLLSFPPFSASWFHTVQMTPIKVTVGLGKTLSPGIFRRLLCHLFFGGGVTARSQALGDVTIVLATPSLTRPGPLLPLVEELCAWSTNIIDHITQLIQMTPQILDKCLNLSLSPK